MLMPTRVKYRKQHRGRMRGKAYRGSEVFYGEYALKATECHWITSRQIEAARRAIVRHLRRSGQVWIRIFPQKAVSARPAETRMGAGKGVLDHYVAVVKPGRILFELGATDEETARAALRAAAQKLPLDTVFVMRETPGGTN